MTACTRFAPMIGARPGELSDEDARALADHLAECDACQARLADETALSGLLSEALMAEANRRDFARFSDEVLARIPEYAARGTVERAPRAPPGFFGWVRHHRALAAFSALAPAAAALALVLYVFGGPSAPPEDPYALDVSAESGAMILQTSDGPVVLLGDSSAEGS